MKKKILIILLISILMCLLIVAITACNNFGNNPDENNTNEDNVESLVAASILNGLAPNIKIVYAISHDGLEYEITFFKVGNHFLLKNMILRLVNSVITSQVITSGNTTGIAFPY